MKNQYQRQLMRELEATTEGAERYLKGINRMEERKQFGEVSVATTVATPFVEAMATSIDNFVEEAKKIRRKPVAVKCLAEANATAVATLTCSAIMSFTGMTTKSQNYANFANAMAISIGRRLDEERMKETLFTENREWFTHLQSRSLSNSEWMKAMEAISDMPTMTAWTTKERYQVGAVMLEFAKDAGLIVEAKEFDGSNVAMSYELSPEVMENLNEMMDAAAMTKPVKKPMICKPKRWTLDDNGNGTGGGYLTTKMNLVKRNSAKKED